MPVPDPDARARLESFRREFPGLPLPELGAQHLSEYIAGEAASGRTSDDLAITREVAQRFISFARSDPGTGSGLLRLRKEQGGAGGEASRYRHEDPYATTSSAGPRVAVHPARKSSGTGNALGALVILLLLAALGGAAYWYAG